MKRYSILLFVIILFYVQQVSAQERTGQKDRKLRSLTLGAFGGTSNGEVENGLGTSFGISYLYRLDKKEKWAIGPYLITGAYRALAIPTDIQNQTFKSSSLGIQTSYYWAGLRIGSGLGYNYTRGSRSENSNFYRTYWHGRSYIGIMAKTKVENIQLEFRPVDVTYGPNDFLQFHLSFLVHFNLR